MANKVQKNLQKEVMSVTQEKEQSHEVALREAKLESTRDTFTGMTKDPTSFEEFCAKM